MNLKRVAVVAAVGGLTLPTYWHAAYASHPDNEGADGDDNAGDGQVDMDDGGCIVDDDDDEPGDGNGNGGGVENSASSDANATNSNRNTSANNNQNSSSSNSSSQSSASSTSSACLLLCNGVL